MKLVEYQHPNTKRSYWMPEPQKPVARLRLYKTGRFAVIADSDIKDDGNKGLAA